MKSKLIGRILSLIVVSVLLALVTRQVESNRHQMGREEFLAKQAERYDKHYAKPDSIALMVVGCFILAVPFFGAYEGIAWGLSYALKGVDEGDAR
jgi:hypothetical protein